MTNGRPQRCRSHGQVFRLLGYMLFTAGLAITRRYLLNVSWRLLMISTVSPLMLLLMTGDAGGDGDGGGDGGSGSDADDGGDDGDNFYVQ